MFIDKIVVGPTASGKTRWAIRWAKENDAEIISADSRQIYKELDIGTGKPDVSDQEGIPHHLIDIVSPRELYSAGKFRTDALEALKAIRGRGKKVLLVGGTGLYLRALIEGFLDLPEDHSPEKDLFYEHCALRPVLSLQEELLRIDPERSIEIMANDRVRITRALWIFHLTGVKPSVLYRERSLPPVPYGEIVGLWWEPERLAQRISRRVRDMIDRGWVNEVSRLLENEYTGEEPAFQSLGYPEILQVVRSGSPLGEAIERIELKTRQYAKRQRTWFRHLRGVHWVEPDDSELIA